MAKLVCSGLFPKRIGKYVVYLLSDVEEPVVRLNSGFDAESWHTADKYVKSRQNASEFGRLTQVCRLFREELDMVLPSYNRKGICNHLVKKLYPFIAMDGVSVWGERSLSEAFKCAEVREAMVGFDFNPDSQFDGSCGTFVGVSPALTYRIDVERFRERHLFPVGSDCVAVQLHRFVFDFETGTGFLLSGGLWFINQDSILDSISMPVPVLEGCTGVDFLLLSVTYFCVNDGSFVPVLKCGAGGIRVLGCGF